MSTRYLSISYAIGFVGSLTCSALADPPTAETCTDLRARSGAVSAYRMFRSGQRCTLSVRQETDSPVYRSYHVTNEGHLMVFNVHGEGPNSTDTSAREFFFFPRSALPSVEQRTDGQLAVTLANSQILRFSPENGAIVESGYTGGTVTEDPSITLTNRGGVEFPSITSGLILDCGWRRGASPLGRSTGSCEARDPAGTRCSIRNTDLFRYAGGEPHFKFATDADLKTLLDRRCPRLETGSLLPSNPAATPAPVDSGPNRAQPADF